MLLRLKVVYWNLFLLLLAVKSHALPPENCTDLPLSEWAMSENSYRIPKASYSSLSVTHAEKGYLPTQPGHYKCLLHQLWSDKSLKNKQFSLTFTATGMSFGTQALPTEESLGRERILIDTRNLKYFELVQRGDPVVVTVGAGMTWQEIHEATYAATKQKTIPFDTPSADQITIGGALSSNTFSRTSDINGDYVSGHVRSFTILIPGSESEDIRIECSKDALEGTFAKDCFYAIPGAMGAAALIETVTIELQPYDERDVVHTEVLDVTRSVKTFVERHLDRVVQNRTEKEFDQGLYSLVIGNMGRPYGVTIGSKTGRIKKLKQFCGNPYRRGCKKIPVYKDERFNDTWGMPLYDGNNWMKGWLIYLGHMLTWTGIPDYIISMFFFEGALYTNPLYDYTFYHNGYWTAHGGDATQPFSTAHQAWVVPNDKLEEFMVMAGSLLDEPDYLYYVYPYILLQDVTPVPKSKMLMSPITQDDLQIYQITVAAKSSDTKRSDMAKAYFRELSKQAHELGVKVHILKEAYVSDEILREQYRANIENFIKVRRQLDPERMILSEQWQVLDPVSPESQ
ncbi:FAD-binding protein [Endozoicomonas arenosclerae]|uniref:FAD-binding protein n=1 Tax=Endozoicomonas arenosclerae TaxID=1633495 RepID=UPI0007810366|nr:FAD-binding protein [Endozoicomonas arenosclerae]